MTRLAPRLTYRRAVLAVAAVAVALTFGLSACSPSGEDTAAAMHASVVQISESAAAGDYAAALAGLALLDRDVSAAVDAGTIEPEREERIRAAMELVRADLESAEVATTPVPEPAPTDDGGGDGGDDGDDGGSDGPGNSGNNGNSGNSGNNGNGNDKGKGDD